MQQINSFEAYIKAYQDSVQNPEQFWSEVSNNFHWTKPWKTTLEWNFAEPNIKWFAGGETNLCYNCLDRHLATKANQTAIIFEPNNPDEKVRKFTYQELYIEVCKFANVLQSLDVKKATVYVYICLWCPKELLRCLPVQGLEPSTPWCLLAFQQHL